MAKKKTNLFFEASKAGYVEPVLSADEVLKEYESKENFLLYNDYFELSDLPVSDFIELVFERQGLTGPVIPFEEKESFEYHHWLDQKRRIKDKKREAERSGDSPTPPTFDYDPSLKIDYSPYRMWRYNPIIFYKEKDKARHRLLLKDDEETMMFLENRKFAIMSPVTYVGRTSSYENARFLYAFAIDVDGIDTEDLHGLIWGMTDKKGNYPQANIIVNSGHGIHLYYLLERPVEMFATRIPLLNKLKRGLTQNAWLVSKLKPQYQPVVQQFRVPGTLTKFGRPIKAFYNSQAPYHTLESLNRFAGTYELSKEELAEISGSHPHNPAKVTLKEAEKLWPEWYASRVIGKKRVGKKWHINRGLYDWWLNKLRDGKEVTIHHRYWCILTLVIYAVKCDIPRDEVEADALSLVPLFDSKTRTPDNPFTEGDVHDAMRAYDNEYNKWTIDTIERTTEIRINKNKRNGREQNVHLRRIRLLQQADYPNGEWRNIKGRKEEQQKVYEWQLEHLECTNKARCARETGLSRTTVHKWWTVFEKVE